MRPADDERALRAAAEVGRRVGTHKVIDDPDLLAPLGADESGLPAAPPPVAVRAESADDVVATLVVAAEHRVPVTPRGRGSGKSGGAIPARGGIVLLTERLDGIVELDRAERLAVVRPGIVLQRFQEAVEAEGLFYPPDPASLDTCALGGNVAENAGGPRAFKYGVTREWVLGLEAVLMGGTRLRTGRRTRKGVAGYDVTAALVGSEGTLAVFTEVTVRLQARPGATQTLLATFDDPVAAGEAVRDLLGSGLVPCVIEILDRHCVEVMRAAGHNPIPGDPGAALLVELDGRDPARVEADALEAGELLQRRAAQVLVASDPGHRRALWAARRELSTLLGRAHAGKLSDDVAVPCGAIPEVLRRFETLGRERGVTVSCYGHAGDGNLHANVLWDDPALDAVARGTLETMLRVVLEHRGTISGEHGIGLAKRNYLAWEQSAELLGLQRRLKHAFDPLGLLNPGKLLPDPDPPSP
ncbi:MAG: FAD-binding protein [Deltaproteobacteria bacterium]|nr:FAD-binding protein [Deltaproteobacteria bacterium]